MKISRIIPTTVVVLLLLSLVPLKVNVRAQEYAYQEDFEDGQAQGWTLEPGWQVIKVGENFVLSGEGHTWARFDERYDDYRLSFRLMLVKGGVHLNFRLNDSGRYFIGFDPLGSRLNKQYWPDTFQQNLATSDRAHPQNEWHQIEIAGNGNTLTLIADGTTEWTYTDPDPFLVGSFAFESLEDSKVHIDDIKVELAATSLFINDKSNAALTWTLTGGPLGGLGYDIRMRADNPDVMYVTDAWAGVHKSTDGGRTWFTLNNGIDARTGPSGDAIPVFCLTIDPNNFDIIWIGLQNLGGVYRSSDGGETWERRSQGIIEQEGLTIRGFSVEPGSSDVVYVAGEISSWQWNGSGLRGREFDRTRGVVYKSTDGGAQWKVAWRGDDLARYIWINPNDHDTVYVSTGIFDREAANSDPTTNQAGGEGVIKSTDGGETWTNINNGLGNLYVGSLFMHPQDAEILLAGTGNNAYPDGGGIYITYDGGANWQHVGGTHITSVEFAVSDPNIAYAAGSEQFFRSEDGGRTWTELVNQRGWGWGPDGIRPGFPIDFQVDPRDPDRIFVNNYGGGNFLSEDGGKTWVSASVGYTGADLRDVSVDPSNPAFVLANGRSGPFLSRDGGVNWQGINPLETSGIAEGARIGVDPSNSNHILLSSAHWGWTFESTDGGSNWFQTTNYGTELQNLPETDTNKKFQGLQAITFARSDPRIVYGGFGIWRCVTDAIPEMCAAKTIVSVLISPDGGHRWMRLDGTALDGLSVSEIVVHPSNADTAWAATVGGGIFRTKDRGQSWMAVNNGLTSVNVMDLSADPGDAAVLYAGTADRGVYKSQDGGETWKQVSLGMDANEMIRAVVVDPLHTNIIYAGSYRSGVFISRNSGASWRLINNGLRTRAVTSLSISADGETLYAGTTGQGVFRLSTRDQTYFDSLNQTVMLTPAATPNPTSEPMVPTPSTEASEPAWLLITVPVGLMAVIFLLVLVRRNRNKGS